MLYGCVLQRPILLRGCKLLPELLTLGLQLVMIPKQSTNQTQASKFPGSILKEKLKKHEQTIQSIAEIEK